MCKYCDNDGSDHVCVICFSKMIYKTDAMKIYGLESSELDDLDCISYKNPYSKYTLCYKYHPNTLYSALKNTIKLLDDGKRKSRLIGKLKILDKEKDDKIKLNELKKMVIKTTKSFLKKFDQKYVKFYDCQISGMADELTCLEFSITDVALTICNKIEELMVEDKKINDQKILADIRESKLCSSIILFCEQYSYFLSAVKSNNFIYFVESGNIDDIELFNNTVTAIKNMIDVKRNIDNKTIIIDKKLKDNKISRSDPRCKYFYNRYINGNLTLKWCEDKIKEIKQCNKESCLRKNKLIELVNEKFGDDHQKYIDLCDESGHFIKYGSLKNIKSIFNKLCDFIGGKKEEEKLMAIKRQIIQITEKHKFNDDIAVHFYMKSILNKTLTLGDIENEMIQKNKKKHYNDFMRNNPEGSKRLAREYKQIICETLYDFCIDNDKTELIIDGVEKNSYFFLKNKCNFLDLKHINIGKDQYRVTK